MKIPRQKQSMLEDCVDTCKKHTKQIQKGTLFAVGLGIGIGTLYSITKLYQKGEEMYFEYKAEQAFEKKVSTDPKYQNAKMLLKFCSGMYEKSELNSKHDIIRENLKLFETIYGSEK